MKERNEELMKRLLASLSCRAKLNKNSINAGISISVELQELLIL